LDKALLKRTGMAASIGPLIPKLANLVLALYCFTPLGA
jgi:hypothetical protein